MLGGLGALLGGVGSIVNAFSGPQGDGQGHNQREFAKHAVTWKVRDAINAGVHPLFALGANTVSYQPSSIGGGTDYSAVGSDIGRAIDAAGTAGQRVARKVDEALITEGLGLDNDIKRATIASMNAKTLAQVGPAFPSVGQSSTGRIKVGVGDDVYTIPLDKGDPSQLVADELGDTMQEIYGAWRTGNSLLNNFNNWAKTNPYDYSMHKPIVNTGFPRGGGYR